MRWLSLFHVYVWYVLAVVRASGADADVVACHLYACIERWRLMNRFPMPPQEERQLEAFDHVRNTHEYRTPSKVYGILNVEERDLPPLPDDAEEFLLGRRPSEDACFIVPQKKSGSELFTPSPLARPSSHNVVFPTRSSSLRPKLLPETDSAPLWIPPTGDHSGTGVSPTPHTSSSRSGSCHASSLRNELEFPSTGDKEHRHTPSRFPDVRSRAPSTKGSSPRCRLPSAVRLPKLPSIIRTAVTTRSVSEANSSIISRPFMRCDGNPLHGITVTVHRQQLISEPESWSPSPTPLPTSISVLSLNKPLPTPAEDLIQDMDPASPHIDDLPVGSPSMKDPSTPDPQVDVDLESASVSQPRHSATYSHVLNRPKRRKRYRSVPYG
ncbi:hypothetical protein C8R46DRAFT_1061656 [Mycena filopes]|nr:hypothetical protein C8R46DRAFT_1061656 [Mycena filopes]